MKWLVRLKLPVNHFPGGTVSCAPPSEAYLLSLEIAEANAFVFDVFPSPTPPNSVKLALCFRQFIAGYFTAATFFRHSTSGEPSKPNMKITEITSKTCRRSWNENQLFFNFHNKNENDL